ncbi:hypothetical protein [Staphylococcus schweitzeri]|uniref:Uncharacterized protein n=1 Tax=Staphylococcus schweitzeri TaxID=1654388 RepID=A0A077UH08_9STAP|nr:hypothetical protein [Staphylococcus schweitzeri]CDR26457.1 hypothetical protein ERS140147_00009 [Staphylococcus schweitzeri]
MTPYKVSFVVKSQVDGHVIYKPVYHLRAADKGEAKLKIIERMNKRYAFEDVAIEIVKVEEI